MINNKTQILISILYISIFLNLNIFAQTAVQPNGSGTVDDPYLIATYDNLNWVSQNRVSWTKYFVQTADIDASASNDGASGFSPIGDNAFQFFGSYNGQGHTINALYINRPADDTIGLFGFTISATIKNLAITNIEITGKNYVGGIVGYSGTSIIDDCSSTGSVTGYKNIGGLVGTCVGTVSYIKNSYSNCTVVGDFDSVGGFVGSSSGTINNCYSTGSVSSNLGSAGGFVGVNMNTISNCFSTGNVIGSSSTSNNMGGFVGAIVAGEIEACFSLGDVINGANLIGGFVGITNMGWIKRCYSSGDVEGYEFVGGFVGFHKNFDINNSYSTGSIVKNGVSGDAVGSFCGKIVETSNISFCFSTGSVFYDGTSTQPTNRGFVSFEEVGGTYTYVSNYFDGNSSGQTTAIGATSASTTDMQQQIGLYTDLFFPNTGLSTAWDFDGTQNHDAATNDYWKMNQNGGYPILVSTFGTSTKSVSNISYQSATSGGHIFYSGSEQITERGVCWNTTSSPTITDSKNLATSNTIYFSANLTGLSEGTTYYVRAYVTNNAGTTYGDEEIFTTTNLTPSGSGTSGDPYLIESLDNLYWVTQNSNSWDKYFKQIADIDATNSSSWDGGAGLLPIGNGLFGNYFEGDYNGNGFEISNLTINRPATDYVALFGYSNGAIYNLGLKSVLITGKNYTGGLVGANYNGSISECFVEGNVAGASIVGGIAGYNNNTISKSFSKANISCSSDNGGGAVGYAYNGAVSESYATGDVSGGNNTGGFVGSNSSSITNCYSIGNATSSGVDVGGFAGENSNGGLIDNCYSVGTASGSNTGGFTGNNAETITASFWDTETSGTSTAVGVGTTTGITGETTANMQTESTFTSAGWDFINDWQMIESDYSKLRCFKNVETVAVAPSGSGTEASPYLIATLNNLLWVSENSISWDSYFEQIADIDASSTRLWNYETGFNPIGKVGASFSGSYNGNNYAISFLTINRNSTNYIGLFGKNEGELKNITLSNASIIGNDNVGVLVGSNYMAGTVISCSTSGTVDGNLYVGGLVGSNYESNVSISNSSTSVSGIDGTGGFVGFNYKGEITNSFSKGNVSATGSSIGGFTGLNSGDATTTGKIINCYSTGSANSPGLYIGGFVGQNNNGFAIMINNFWDTETSGTTDGVGYGDENGLVGQTTTSMKLSTTFTSVGWDFTNIWNTGSGINDGYPNLEGAVAPTPVELTSFTAKLIDKNIIVNWQTATEVNNYGFEIQMADISNQISENSSENGWETIAFVEGHGNSNSPNDYSFVASISSATKLSFRLKQIDFDGAFEYSDIVTVEIGGNLEYKLSQNHPNPFNPSTQITFAIPSAGVVKLNVYNILGEVVAELINETLEAGSHQYQFNASNLTSGIYFYSISVNGFTEVKKMNLIK